MNKPQFQNRNYQNNPNQKSLEQRKTMQPLTDNQMKRFIRYPNPKSMKVFKPQENESPYQQKPNYNRKNDYYQTNKRTTDQINNFDKTKREVLGAPQPYTTNAPMRFDLSRDQGHQTPRTVQSITPNQDYKPTSEDQKLLLYLLEMKYMSQDQIDRKFLKNQKSHENFRKLLDHGFLKTRPTEKLSSALIIPTEKAFELIQKENPDKKIPKHPKRFFDPILNHDLKLVELRMRFEELNFLNKWHSENALEEVPLMKRLFQDLPDAVCKKKNDKSYFLELEISQKSQKKYEERIALYEKILQNEEIQDASIEGVIFLCTDEKVYDVIKSKHPKSKTFSVLMLDRYIQKKESAA